MVIPSNYNRTSQPSSTDWRSPIFSDALASPDFKLSLGQSLMFFGFTVTQAIQVMQVMQVIQVNDTSNTSKKVMRVMKVMKVMKVFESI